ncbi:MAG: chromosome segregation protein SMC [Bacteroidetes bacterium]|nr:chromosome segregation protein SMC [Bacteroidota bacterium]
MYLSKIDIVGFKSFANKTNLKFDSGITAIVGPNGCGKTNIVDALRWVLGEQKPTTLRSDKMEDVIFNGTKNRKPISAADVSLTIENTKGILPIEYSEVKITRRVYRSGESEYLLNDTLCRLKDIRDLFMDTGMGSDAYSVIELKMVETILSDRADDRRRLFEEAAGVTKYKHRRKEAIRKLESTQQDLVRVNDIVKEIQKAVNSLERQAKKAEQYNLISKELREVESDVIQREYTIFQNKIIPLEQELHTAKSEKNKIDSVLEEQEVLLDSMRLELTNLETKTLESSEEIQRIQEHLNKLQKQEISSNERKNFLTTSIERYHKDKIDLSEQLKNIEVNLVEVQNSIPIFESDKVEADKNYKIKKAEYENFSKQLDSKRNEFNEAQNQVIKLLEVISSKRQELERIKTRIENMQGRIQLAEEENQNYNKSIQTNKNLIVDLTSRDKELRKQFAQKQVEYSNFEKNSEQLLEETSSKKINHLSQVRKLERIRSRAEFLTKLIEDNEGLSEGSRYLLHASEWKNKIPTTVVDAIKTSSKYRNAIEASIGSMAGFLIVDSFNDAINAGEYLRKEKLGKATFICLDRLPSYKSSQKQISETGVVDYANNLITIENKYSQLFNIILGNTLIVEKIEHAQKIISNSEINQCVTLDGEIVTKNGLYKLGSQNNDSVSFIDKKNQLDEINSEVKNLEKEIHQLEDAISKNDFEINKIDLKKLRENVKETEAEMTSVEMKIAQLEFEKKRIEEAFKNNIAEIEKQKEEILKLEKESAKILPTIDQLEFERSEIDQKAGAIRSELEALEIEAAELNQFVEDAKVILLNTENKLANTKKEIEYNKKSIDSINTTIKQRDVDIVEAEKEISLKLEELATIESALAMQQEEFEKVAEEKKQIDKVYNSKRNKMHEVELNIKDERRLHDTSLGKTHELEIKIAELKLKSDNLKQRALSDFELILELKSFPNEDNFNLEEANKIISEMKEKLKSLGPINFAAFDEYSSEKERLDFILVQRHDLQESEKTLVQTIDEINTTAQQKFFDTFSIIRENFITTFKGLFDEGDECDLRLEKDVDPLEAKIEIVAKPRGKRPTSIDLLSGGEKTLTAIALLFAIYLVKPSPFCILDEVDAPLDDANIDRFAKIIKKFSENTQFIIVTHNKRTMESANAMYGVTMEEDGVSKLVSVKFEKEISTLN